jgi:hypothetical protein
MCPDSFAARAATYSNSRWHAELAERFVAWLGRAFRLRQAVTLLVQPGDPAVKGALAEHLAAIS